MDNRSKRGKGKNRGRGGRINRDFASNHGGKNPSVIQLTTMGISDEKHQRRQLFSSPLSSEPPPRAKKSDGCRKMTGFRTEESTVDPNETFLDSYNQYIDNLKKKTEINTNWLRNVDRKELYISTENDVTEREKQAMVPIQNVDDLVGSMKTKIQKRVKGRENATREEKNLDVSGFDEELKRRGHTPDSKIIVFENGTVATRINFDADGAIGVRIFKNDDNGDGDEEEEEESSDADFVSLELCVNPYPFFETWKRRDRSGNKYVVAVESTSDEESDRNVSAFFSTSTTYLNFVNFMDTFSHGNDFANRDEALCALQDKLKDSYDFVRSYERSNIRVGSEKSTLFCTMYEKPVFQGNYSFKLLFFFSETEKKRSDASSISIETVFFVLKKLRSK